MKLIRVATRKSALALAQTRRFIAQLKALHPGLEVEELQVTTTGDRVLDRPLAEVGGKGLFLKELEEELLRGGADLAVHSLKDVPPDLPPGLSIVCVPEREDPRDVLVTRGARSLLELPPGARIGTSSLRRAVQVRLLRGDVEVVSVRGNVGTRLSKCQNGEVDAVLLARAGLNRLELTGSEEGLVFTDLSPAEVLPAVGQGALGIECSSLRQDLVELLARLASPEATIAVAAERGLMKEIEGDCRTPVAAYAVRDGAELYLRGFLSDVEGTEVRRGERRRSFPTTFEEAHELGRDLGRELRARV